MYSVQGTNKVPYYGDHRINLVLIPRRHPRPPPARNSDSSLHEDGQAACMAVLRLQSELLGKAWLPQQGISPPPQPWGGATSYLELPGKHSC